MSTNPLWDPGYQERLRLISEGHDRGAAATAHKHARSPAWPDPMADEAYYGVAGDAVRIIEPHSEADPAAMLVQMLVCAGNLFGRGPAFQVEADRHHANLYAAVVGQTAAGRKGTSFAHAKNIVSSVDFTWEERVAGGASSGEGLIWQVRDAIVRRRKAKKNEEDEADGEGLVEETVDEGIADKRLLLYESEFASLLA